MTAAEIIEACAKVCEEQERQFLDPAYAAGQPLGSFSERFACRECAHAIRQLNIEAELQQQVGMETPR